MYLRRMNPTKLDYQRWKFYATPKVEFTSFCRFYQIIAHLAWKNRTKWSGSLVNPLQRDAKLGTLTNPAFNGNGPFMLINNVLGDG